MSDRIYKINELLKQEVSQLLLRELGDHKGFVTITAVETTPDLRQSTIWYAVFGENPEKIGLLITEKEKTIQALINSRLSIKHVPKLTFRLDQSGDYANKINKLIDEANNERG